MALECDSWFKRYRNLRPGRTLSSDVPNLGGRLDSAPNYFAARGSAQGSVRNLSGAPIFGAHVVLVDGTEKSVVSALTESDGGYFVRGLEPGTYSAFAEPLDQPLTETAILTLGEAFPNQTPNTTFTTRFATTESQPSGLSLNKTGGDSQTGDGGQALTQPLEVIVRDGVGNPVAGTLVRFAASSGGGAVVPIQAATDAQGKARTTAYLGKGQIQAFTAQSTVFLDITSRVLFGGEQGLLGLAFHAQYSANGRFFVNYTRQPDGATVIAEYRVSAGNSNLSDSTETVLLTIPQPFANHNGGMIELGPDGFRK